MLDKIEERVLKSTLFFVGVSKVMQDVEVVLIDIGNTQIKSVEVQSGMLVNEQTETQIEIIDRQYPDIPFMVSSVRKDVILPQRAMLLNRQTPIPLHLSYKTPETLGMDRVAAAVGANHLFPDKYNLVIDMGTCMTMDVVTPSKKLLGGVISPGLRMRMRAMYTGTQGLPDLSAFWEKVNKRTIGNSTSECLLAGSFYGVIHEINGFIQANKKNITPLNVIITGGDAHFFDSYINAHIFTSSKVVQKGLYVIWKYQSDASS